MNLSRDDNRGPYAMQFDARRLAVTALLMGLCGHGAHAAQIELVEWAANLDGQMVGDNFDPPPSNLDMSGFDFVTGLGTMTARVAAPGEHYVGFFFDHEIDQANNLWYNETGEAVGTPTHEATRQLTWEIDEPGYGMDGGRGPYVGDNLFYNLQDSLAFDSLLDNLVFNSFGRCDPALGGDTEFCDDPDDYFFAGTREPIAPNFKADAVDDVSMALGWSFLLGPDAIALVSITASETQPDSGFYLIHSDPDSDVQFYLSSNLVVRQAPVPATAALLLLGIPAIGALGGRRREKPQ